ncbi:hypothetical protein GCM10008090_23740 [Arenicella chitinivorans]|uniref:Uncharacterized protein n=1 Tax=Arenicella chitinivorans TaxID=1329800 RepID=A0A918RVZ2_9GAMM|nr:hypothetical protein [Arenicella chitinivorans]GHA13272.1 hypothetical protein GCM10008090_23740 [Arenicella chitinivorans]
MFIRAITSLIITITTGAIEVFRLADIAPEILYLVFVIGLASSLFYLLPSRHLEARLEPKSLRS